MCCLCEQIVSKQREQGRRWLARQGWVQWWQIGVGGDTAMLQLLDLHSHVADMPLLHEKCQ